MASLIDGIDSDENCMPVLVVNSYLLISYTACMSATAIVSVHCYTLVMLLVLQLLTAAITMIFIDSLCMSFSYWTLLQ
jgi:hypothetical protein